MSGDAFKCRMCGTARPVEQTDPTSDLKYRRWRHEEEETFCGDNCYANFEATAFFEISRKKEARVWCETGGIIAISIPGDAIVRLDFSLQHVIEIKAITPRKLAVNSDHAIPPST